jgi:hypothetical protein
MRALVVVLLALATACADEGLQKDPTGEPVTITLWNRSQFELIDVRVHEDETYAEAPNVLTAPLAAEAQLPLDAQVGDFVTVIRRKIEVGDTIALTTARRLDDMRTGSTLVVFDEAFRLLPPSQPVEAE